MTMTKGRIERVGAIGFGDAYVYIREEGISAARAAGGWPAEKAWERQFKRDVFARIVQTLRRIGWSVLPWDESDQYKAIALNHRTCSKGDLKGQLEMSGRCIKFEMWQDVTLSENRNGGRYDFGKEARMPYLLRIEMERARLRIRDYLLNAFTGYVFEPSAPKIGLNGATALEYAKHSQRSSGHYVEHLGRASFNSPSNGFTRDGVAIEDGAKVYAITRKGRVVYGAAYYSLNGRWMVVTGKHGVEWADHRELYAACPGDPRVKRNARQRRQRIEGEMASAIKAMKFERAAVLRDILFPGKPALFAIWNEQNSLYHRAGTCGYTSDLSEAGKFTEDEVRGWDRAPNKVIALSSEAVPA
ncbi:hypothetical protein ASF61_06595 [Duganella sp. Leaf126]|uniref:hypothetical protein n=1 Tax=Duganella sp. Leaf126 TaxID=1736266 RepID=UPI0006F53D6C|nr:hypothetical protein [Duganella sp. Leaf126]KQQ40418.1 hypothetical protein ASF61_06595 [Duganella sp. Leaf126]